MIIIDIILVVAALLIFARGLWLTYQWQHAERELRKCQDIVDSMLAQIKAAQSGKTEPPPSENPKS